MLITEELFAAFINCETKSFLQLMETGADRSEFLEWQRRNLDDYKLRCNLRLQASCHASDEYYLGSLATGHLLHADETRISIAGGTAYVWVFTNLEEVALYYTETREGEVLKTLFGTFEGVLVSDFYAAYDSMSCPQQKCLIHLIRDLNEDLGKQRFDKELEQIVRGFSSVLQPIVETIDRFGLKTRFLRKHKRAVEEFFLEVANADYQSEITIKYKKRFEKNRDKLFTFLDYDGVPWNNNNAEHAIKSFALLRNVIRGSSSPRGIQDYATLLSICETCKYKGVSFLDFLRSGCWDVDDFIKTNSAGRGDARRTTRILPSGIVW